MRSRRTVKEIRSNAGIGAVGGHCEGRSGLGKELCHREKLLAFVVTRAVNIHAVSLI